MLPVIFLVNLRTHGFVQVPQARGRQRCSDKRARNVYNDVLRCDVLRCEAPPPNLNPPIFLFWPLGTKPPNLMNRQYFRLYGISSVNVFWWITFLGDFMTNQVRRKDASYSSGNF